MYFTIFFTAWLVSVLEANGFLRGISSMLVVDIIPLLPVKVGWARGVLPQVIIGEIVPSMHLG